MKSPLSLIQLATITLILTPFLPTSSSSRTSIITQRTGGTEGDLIASACKSTPDAHLCETSLRSDPRSGGANTKELILIMIDVVESGFVDSLRYVNDLIKDKVHEPRMLRALKRCAEVYKVVLDYNVNTATKAVSLGAPKFGEQAMVDSGIEAQSCERGFQSVGRSPLSDRNEFLFGVSNVAASLVKIME